MKKKAYTTIKDKHGKQIYNGDILRGIYEDDDDPESQPIVDYGYVAFENGCFVLKWINYKYTDILSDVACYMEVIGNINDDPSLFERITKQIQEEQSC